jgi:protein-S-isoprenylcysteine O-methyltransferase Ste14
MPTRAAVTAWHDTLQQCHARLRYKTASIEGARVRDQRASLLQSTPIDCSHLLRVKRMPEPSRFRILLSRSRAWSSLLLLAPIATAAAFTRPYLRFDGLPEYFVEALAWIVFLAGACFRWWATLYIGGRKTKQLVSDGPYSICRNPIYLGTVLLTLSVAIFLQSVTLFIATLAVTVFYLTITVPIEEARLKSKHGRAFEEYCRRTPKFLPRFSLYRTPQELQVRLVGIRAEFLRMLQWSSIPLICYLVEHLRMLPNWPTPFFLP